MSISTTGERTGRSVAYLTAGAAGMICGSCLRDNALCAALARLGCDVHLIPSYTPTRTDEENVSLDTVFFGGVNVFLQQKWSLFRRLPPFLDRWLDRPSLINFFAGRGIETNAHELGSLTLSMLAGEAGHQRKEVHRLVDWLGRHLKPDLVNLTNILIAGCAPVLKAALDVPILVTLQGDDLFLDGLADPYREQALAKVRQLAGTIDGFVVFSHYYAEFMSEYLKVPFERFHIVPLGIGLDDFPAEPAPRREGPPTVGYLARVCPEKGIGVLTDAFIRLAGLPGMDAARLKLAGWLSHKDRPFFADQLEKLAAAGLGERVEYAGVVDRAEKLAFLGNLHLFSVPTTYREPKGLFVLEALASGVPVVQPAHGSFPELLAQTGGGRLFTPGNTDELAATLHELLQDRSAREALGREGRERVRAGHDAGTMAAATLAVYEKFWDRTPEARPVPKTESTRTSR